MGSPVSSQYSKVFEWKNPMHGATFNPMLQKYSVTDRTLRWDL